MARDAEGVMVMDCFPPFPGQVCTERKGGCLVLDSLPLPVVKAVTEPCFNNLA